MTSVEVDTMKSPIDVLVIELYGDRSKFQLQTVVSRGNMHWRRMFCSLISSAEVISDRVVRSPLMGPFRTVNRIAPTTRLLSRAEANSSKTLHMLWIVMSVHRPMPEVLTLGPGAARSLERALQRSMATRL